MTSKQPPDPAPPADQAREPPLRYYGTPPWLHAGAIAVTILGPLALLLPPRRLSVQNVILSGGSYWGFNQLVHDYTGKSIWARSNERWGAAMNWGNALPERAEQNRALMAAERARREATLPEEERRALEAGRQGRGRGVLERLWMGGEKDGWKEQRIAKEREALESGKGYSGLIADQIWDVWNQKEKNGDKDRQGKPEVDARSDTDDNSGRKPPRKD